MKDITLLIRVREDNYPVDKQLVNYLIWRALFGRGNADFELAFPITKMLVHSITETPEPPEDEVFPF